MYRNNLGMNRVCTWLYTWVVILSCTVVGHYYSNLFGMYILTVAVIILTLIITLICAVTAMKNKVRIGLNIALVVYVIAYLSAAFRGNLGIDTFLPLAALLICAYLGGAQLFDMKLARRVIEWIAIVATVLLLIQVCWNAIFGEHIQILSTFWLTEEQFESYYVVITEGHAPENNYYRPSSIFLEPSHYVQFTIVALLSSLYPIEKRSFQLRKVMLFTVGIIATVSSTGLLLLILCWGLWFFSSDSGRNLPKWIKTLLVGLIISVFVAMFFAQNTTLGIYLQRIMPSNLGNLISNQSDRFWSLRYLNSFSTSELTIGRGIGTLPSGFLTAYVRQVYQMGYLGFFSYLLFLIKAAYIRTGFSRNVCIVYCVLLFGAEVDVFRYVIFFLTFVFAMKAEHKNRLIVRRNFVNAYVTENEHLNRRSSR